MFDDLVIVLLMVGGREMMIISRILENIDLLKYQLIFLNRKFQRMVEDNTICYDINAKLKFSSFLFFLFFLFYIVDLNMLFNA